MHKLLGFCHKKSVGLLILRVFVGVIFIIHGVQKFYNAEAMISFFGQIGLVSPFWMYLTASVETVAGIALILGIFTRVASASLVVIGVCAIYFFKWQIGAGSWLTQFAAAELDLILIGANLALIFTGSGKLALWKWCKCLCHKECKDCNVCAVIGCDSCDHPCSGATCPHPHHGHTHNS